MYFIFIDMCVWQMFLAVLFLLSTDKLILSISLLQQIDMSLQRCLIPVLLCTVHNVALLKQGHMG